MTVSGCQVHSIAWLLLAFLYTETIAAADDCSETSRPRLITPDNPYFGYRPRPGDRVYPGRTRQDQYNARVREDKLDSGLWREPKQSDCPPPAWSRTEDWGYRPRDYPSRGADNQEKRQQHPVYDYSLYPRAGYFGPYWGVGSYPVLVDRLYPPGYLYAPDPGGYSATRPSNKKR